MEKRVLGLILSILGAIGLIYAGVRLMGSGLKGSEIKQVVVAAILGAVFFFAGISLVKNTRDKAT